MIAAGRKGAAGALCALVMAAAPAAAGQPGAAPGSPPEVCADDLFSDLIGTDRDDRLRALPGRAQRLWGLEGADRLRGSATRATCLLGGPGGDVLDLDAGGGAVWGHGGADAIAGSGVSDRVDGGPSRDAIDSGGGNDNVMSEDGNAEVVHCGLGHDLARADRADVLVGCEVAMTSGPSTPMLRTRPRAARAAGVVRIAFPAPRAAASGAYRVLVTTGARGADCVDGPVTLARGPRPGHRVAAGERVRIAVRPPAEGWCAGVTRAAVVLHRPCMRGGGCRVPPPGEPIARLRFSSGA